MRKVIKVKTTDGQTVKVMLDTWGGGVDRSHRRWTLQPDGWHCIDTGEIAQGLNSFLNRPTRLWGVLRR